MFASCGPVQGVDVRDKPGPGEKTEKLSSKFFSRRTATVKLGGEITGASLVTTGRNLEY